MAKNPRIHICAKSSSTRSFYQHVFAYISDTFRLRQMVPNFDRCFSARVTTTRKSIDRSYGSSLRMAVWGLAVYISALLKLRLFHSQCSIHFLRRMLFTFAETGFIVLDILFTSAPSQSVYKFIAVRIWLITQTKFQLQSI